MYKVFIDNIPIYFQKDKSTSSSLPNRFLPALKINDFNLFRSELKQSNQQRFFFNSPDPEQTMNQFFKNFITIEAAGGIVQNVKTQHLLFIYRNDHWDIPKGKIEKDESPEEAAIREIQEECGITSLKIIKPLTNTFHVYFAYNNYYFKKNYWYFLETDEINVKPQLEEDIREVRWFKNEDLYLVVNNTFASIKAVIEPFKSK
ncbi:hypothetical protein CW751_03710 [Brumimicrobium salinarum]|uniref:Nudix hydrolase domain-containing protein n=1 Tax=Brumimicrobium salinarum TaxID=2058658 RepID=A0A2I0R4X7_9FLAO|nr:NUDIX domain-containing protein [Brumimicrobium salinarum]PKR81642.1 hypothetical protein CW751_03710 [Brumimicrobium salinarum]